LPLRADLAGELREWVNEKRDRFLGPLDAFGRESLFSVAESLGKILDRDLQVAGIAKADDRGRTVDVHSLRTTFGTFLSKGGVAPRTAQAAMRHSNIDLTMNVYTDPRLLDVQGALNALPALVWSPPVIAEPAVMRATGTDDRNATMESRPAQNSVAPDVAPTTGQRGHFLSFPVIQTKAGDQRTEAQSTPPMPQKLSKNKAPAVFAGKVSKCSREGSNLQPSASEADALSN